MARPATRISTGPTTQSATSGSSSSGGPPGDPNRRCSRETAAGAPENVGPPEADPAQAEGDRGVHQEMAGVRPACCLLDGRTVTIDPRRPAARQTSAAVRRPTTSRSVREVSLASRCAAARSRPSIEDMTTPLLLPLDIGRFGPHGPGRDPAALWGGAVPPFAPFLGVGMFFLFLLLLAGTLLLPGPYRPDRAAAVGPEPLTRRRGQASTGRALRPRRHHHRRVHGEGQRLELDARGLIRTTTGSRGRSAAERARRDGPAEDFLGPFRLAATKLLR